MDIGRGDAGHARCDAGNSKVGACQRADDEYDDRFGT